MNRKVYCFPELSVSAVLLPLETVNVRTVRSGASFVAGVTVLFTMLQFIGRSLEESLIAFSSPSYSFIHADKSVISAAFRYLDVPPLLPSTVSLNTILTAVGDAGVPT